MLATNCIVCDPDEQYARSLAEYINRKKEFHLSAQPFTDPEKLLSYARRQRVDLLLINEKQLSDSIREEVITCCVFSEDDTQGQYLRKYSSAAEMVRKALRFTLKVSVGQGNILAVYSPVGRCGKTCFALALAGTLARKAPTLYLNLEDYPWIGIQASEEATDEGGRMWDSATLSDLLYNIHTMSGKGGSTENTGRQAAFREELEKAVHSMGSLDLIEPAPSSCDLRDITSSEWEMFLRMLTNGTAYDYLVLDVGTQMPDVFRILNLCGRIYVPVLDDPYSKGKMIRFEMTLRLLRGSEGTLERKIRKLILPQVQTGDFSHEDFLDRLLASPIGAAAQNALRQNIEGEKKHGGACNI